MRSRDRLLRKPLLSEDAGRSSSDIQQTSTARPLLCRKMRRRRFTSLFLVDAAAGLRPRWRGKAPRQRRASSRGYCRIDLHGLGRHDLAPIDIVEMTPRGSVGDVTASRIVTTAEGGTPSAPPNFFSSKASSVLKVRSHTSLGQFVVRVERQRGPVHIPETPPHHAFLHMEVVCQQSSRRLDAQGVEQRRPEASSGLASCAGRAGAGASDGAASMCWRTLMEGLAPVLRGPQPFSFASRGVGAASSVNWALVPRGPPI